MVSFYFESHILVGTLSIGLKFPERYKVLKRSLNEVLNGFSEKHGHLVQYQSCL